MACEMAVCPPYPYLGQAQLALQGSPLALGAQSLSEHASGAFTGEVSAAMLLEFGCRYVLVGHSERRALFGETDAVVAAKFAAAQEAGYAEHLSREGENLSLVIEYLRKQHQGLFTQILEKLARRVPGITKVESKVTDEGRVLLKFQDGVFEDPFLARYVSDGTIKMLAYLVLLLDPAPHPLLCVEEPENQLYPSLLFELAEEFRDYARRGGQVFVSTHSPDFLNAVQLDEAYWLVKEGGYTSVRRAADDPQLRAYVEAGDQLGYLWKQGLLKGANP